MAGMGSWLAKAGRRLRAVPVGLQVVLGVALVTGLAVGSVMMYRTYEFVEHDNAFCLECHLMREPFDRFARSAHRGLGCKACHQPNIFERTQMGLAQILEQPDEIRVHAHVSNRVCAECHIEGDPDRWIHIANTAGHRTHLESDHPGLRGVQCVQCHSSSVHEFAATDRTCGQGGCHEDTSIRLGRMADLTVHCVTCHEFIAPVAPAAHPAEVAAALRPHAQDCLACHQMRVLMAGVPPDEPHDGQCGACHNPHAQTTPREAVRSCATAGCHAQPETLTSFHRGLAAGVLSDCAACHQAHEFRVHDGMDCLSCHLDIFRDAPPTRPISGPVRPTPNLPVAVAAHRAWPDARAAAGAAAGALAGAGALSQDTTGFWHSQHRRVQCTACHSMERTHGAVTVTSIRDCRSCHHTERAAVGCEACHAPARLRRTTFDATRVMDMRIGRLDRPVRPLPFDHAAHTDVACTRCHTEGLALSAARVDCSACHQEHHRPTTSCLSCHLLPRAGAHGPEVHLGCAGSGCHMAVPEPVRMVPRTRSFCLVCHQDLVDHRPGQNCEVCHALPRTRATVEPAPGAGPAPGRAPALGES